MVNTRFQSAHCKVDDHEDAKKNKFRQREASDDQLPYPNMDELTLTNTQCPHHVELRWQTEVSSSIYATPLIADINSDGKLDVIVPTFVHNLEILDGLDGEKMPGWPSSHQSTAHSSPLLYDIDKDAVREIALATYNGEVLFFRPSGYMMTEKLIVPRERVRKDWYVGIEHDHADRSHPDIHDDSLVAESIHQASSNDNIKSSSTTPNVTSAMPHSFAGSNVSVDNSSAVAGLTLQSTGQADLTPLKDGDTMVNRSTTNGHGSALPANNLGMKDNNLSDLKIAEGEKQEDLLGSGLKMGAAAHNESQINAPMFHAAGQRRLHEDADSTVKNSKENGEKQKTPTVENDQESLDDAADASFDVFRDEEENMEDGLTEEYQYDYDDYVDEAMWGDENWKEVQHEKEEDYINIDAHILCTPVIADIDRDGVDEMVVAASYFFDREYYDKPENAAELGGADISKYVAGAIVVFNLNTQQVKWKKLLDLSTDVGRYRAYIYSAPTVVDLDNDGYLDIVVGTAFGFCYVLDHRGEFREKFPLLMGEIQGQVLAADVNDDGKIELVTTDTRGNVAAWTSQGKEIWEVHLKSLIAQGPTVGDVDGDGRTDLVIPTISGRIYVLKGLDGSHVRPYPFRTHGRIMAPVLLVDLNKPGTERGFLTLVVTSFDGYLYLIDGPTACADAIDVGETSYSMVLADNVDGGDDLDLIVTTMNGNVFCFSTPAQHHPMKAWSSQSQGRNVLAARQGREGIHVLPSSRAFRDEGGESFWLQFNIIDNHRSPSDTQGPYNVTATLLVPSNYMGEKRISQNQMFDQPGRYQFKMPCVQVHSSGTVLLEMVDKNGMYFSDEFALTFHFHYYRLLKWLLVLPMLGMFCILLWLQPKDGVVLPSFSRDRYQP